MPHATSDTMGEPMVNGEEIHSQFLEVSTSRTIPPNTCKLTQK